MLAIAFFPSVLVSIGAPPEVRAQEIALMNWQSEVESITRHCKGEVPFRYSLSVVGGVKTSSSTVCVPKEPDEHAIVLACTKDGCVVGKTPIPAVEFRQELEREKEEEIVATRT